jgi:hypothetical protein
MPDDGSSGPKHVAFVVSDGNIYANINLSQQKLPNIINIRYIR